MLTSRDAAGTVPTMPPSDSRQSHRDRQRLETRERIFAAAIDELASSGLDRADIGAIVERAGVARGTFYFHFATKSDVLLELQRREIDIIVDHLEADLTTAHLSDLVHEVLDAVLASERRLGTSLFRDMVSVNFGRAHSASEQVSSNRLVEYIADAAGNARSDQMISDDVDPLELTAIILVGLFGLLAASDGPTAERDELAHRYLDTIIRGST